MYKLVFLLLVSFVIPIQAYAGETGSVTGLPLPRFVSLKFAETNLRKGPNPKYPVTWVYKIKNYPMEVTAEFENWRRLRDTDGSEGWVHENLINGSRNVLIMKNEYTQPNPEYERRSRELVLFRYPDENSYPMLRVEFGAMGKLKSCDQQWCKIKIEDTTAWVRKANLWGVYPEEIVK